jgi:RHS repeat-associated protein
VISSGASSNKVEFWHKDHLGSTIASTDLNGLVTQRYSYDVWGKKRNLDGSPDPNSALIADNSNSVNAGTDRGFTGHEHLDDVGIVHMNGRTYDPLLGRFMQPDPMIQNPANLQNYNRYSYCYNNALNCTDPSGYWSLTEFLSAGLKLADDLGRAPFRSHTQNYAINSIFSSTHALPGTRQIDNYMMTHKWARTAGTVAACAWSWVTCAIAKSHIAYLSSGGDAGAARSAFNRSVITAAAYYVVGVYTGGSPGSIENVFGHAIVGCGAAVAGGQKCGPGALSAAFSAGMKNPGLGAFSTTTGSDFGGLVQSMVYGGIASRLGGGKFGDGAESAAMGYIFNQLKGGRGPNEIGNVGKEAAFNALIADGYDIKSTESLVAIPGIERLRRYDYIATKDGVTWGVEVKASTYSFFVINPIQIYLDTQVVSVGGTVITGDYRGNPISNVLYIGVGLGETPARWQSSLSQWALEAFGIPAKTITTKKQ